MGDAEDKDLINILYISSFGNLCAGSQISLWNLLSRLDRTKFNPTLIYLEEGDLLSSSQEIGIPTEVIAISPLRFWSLISILTSLVKLSKIVRKYRIDIVHADDLREVLYFGILKLFLKFKLIWHIRVSWKNIVFDTIGFHLSDKIICTAEIITDKFKHLSNYKQKVKTIYNAIDHNYFKPSEPNLEIKKRYNIGSNDFVIGIYLACTL